MNEIENKINEHDKRLQRMEDHSLQSAQQTDKLVGELQTLSADLRETVITFREYTVKHDNLRESNIKLWQKYEKQNDAIASINLTNAKNQEAINSVISIKNKVLLVVLMAILSPITVGAAILFSKG